MKERVGVVSHYEDFITVVLLRFYPYYLDSTHV